MRKLMWFTVGFAFACLLSAYFLPQTLLLSLALATGTAGVLLAALCRGHKPRKRAALALLGCGVGLGWCLGYNELYISGPASLDGVTRCGVLQTSDYSVAGDYGASVDAEMTVDGKGYSLRLYLRENISLEPGQILSGDFRFRLTTAQGQEGATYHPGKGVFLLAYQAGEVVVAPGERGAPRYFPARARQRICKILESCFPPDASPFAKALILGDTSDLDYATDTALKVSGIRHVAAVSGLHVSVLFAVLCFVTGRKRGMLLLLGLPALGLFAALAGFTPSVTRACLMCVLMVLALVCDREYDGATALSFAVLVMLALNPLAITGMSFQLSVASVAGILLFGGRFRQRLLGCFGETKDKMRAGLARWFSSGVSVTLSAQVFTLPLCACAFGVVSLIGVVTNLLTLGVVSFLFCGILATVCAALVWPAAGAVLGGVLSLPIRYVLGVARYLAGVPLGAVYTQSPYIVVWLVVAYGLLLVYLGSRRQGGAAILCTGVLTLCLAMLLSWLTPMLDGTRLTVLDVGQGQCLLLQSGGRTYMVDCGGDTDASAADMAAGTLLSQGITRLDGLIITHPDRDHAGAVEELLTRVDADVLILPPAAEDLARATQAPVVYAQQDLELTFDGGKITIFSSPFRENANESGLGVLFDTEKCDILITADRSALGERALLGMAALPKVDVLIAGHHGAADATCEELLEAVHPEVVCISAGEDNPYGHPAQETLLRLLEYGCTIYRTDREGTIIIRR